VGFGLKLCTSALAQHPPQCASCPSLRSVYSGALWITDACTRAGRFRFSWHGGGESLSARWVAAANAIAGGMMLAASGLLIVEAATFEMPGPRPAAGAARTPLDALAALPSAVHMLLGLGAGVAFVRGSQSLLHRYEHLEFHGFKGARRERWKGRGVLT